MRLLLAIAIIVATSNVVAAEKPKDNPPKEQWIEITKPVIGCFMFGSDIEYSPKLIPAIESGEIIGETGTDIWRVECSMMRIGDKYIYDKPVLGYTTFISVICEHCSPYAYPVYTKAKGNFYKNIPTPANSEWLERGIH